MKNLHYLQSQLSPYSKDYSIAALPNSMMCWQGLEQENQSTEKYDGGITAAIIQEAAAAESCKAVPFIQKEC